MKPLLLFLFLSQSISLFSQNPSGHQSTVNFIKEKGIKLNTVTPPAGFRVYYNCDSLLFMKGVFGDTIKIWTTALDFYHKLENFKNVVQLDNFGVTEFAKSIDNDGRILVSSYHQTQFIFRNDSLFEILNTGPSLAKPIAALHFDYSFNGKIDKATYEARLDSLQKIEKKQAIYTPKLIFTKNMFKKGNKVKLSKNENFDRDEIELEKEWVQNGKSCYIVRINNKEDGEPTTYAYAINQDMTFIFWEECQGH